MGGGKQETLLLNLFIYDVNVAAGGHVGLNVSPPTHQQLYIQTTQKTSLKMPL